MGDLRCPQCGSNQTNCCAPKGGEDYIETKLWEISLPHALVKIKELETALAGLRRDYDLNNNRANQNATRAEQAEADANSLAVEKVRAVKRVKELEAKLSRGCPVCGVIIERG